MLATGEATGRRTAPLSYSAYISLFLGDTVRTSKTPGLVASDDSGRTTACCTVVRHLLTSRCFFLHQTSNIHFRLPDVLFVFSSPVRTSKHIRWDEGIIRPPVGNA